MTKSGSFQMIKNYSQVSALLPKKDPKAGKRRTSARDTKEKAKQHERGVRFFKKK